ncbi:TolC family protein [Roseisalinus antarcticus]|uniref:Outer membrane efflux protein n=1 Tax=Roseisalinus antarcticus TaxID=254357 RepID=A0A1Y5SHW9_9RHOB|nr:TolC family protein [Roseisalinus antarcticus]SLN39535.1 Outer membrane efflux protein [Roseisalinus antarcticus]
MGQKTTLTAVLLGALVVSGCADFRAGRPGQGGADAVTAPQARRGPLAAAGDGLAAMGSGLVETTRGAFGFLDRDEAPDAAPPARTLDPTMQDGTASEIISTLLTRRSVLEPGPLRDVASAVLAANSRTAEAELRAARLRSAAAERNWLPSIGPQISLSSLGDVVSSLVVDAVLYDNGAKIAERDYARADVEVAAVALAENTNERVMTALDLYLDAEASRARAAVTQAALARMERFDYVMAERMRAGVADRADRQLVAQRLSQMRSDLSSDREAAATARAELAAMTAYPIDDVSGVSDVAAPDPGAEPLSVMKARAEADRSVAEATVARAAQLPGLSATGSIVDGESSGGLVAGGTGIGFGTPAALRAIEAQREAASFQVADAREAADRRLRQLSGQLASAQRQAREAQGIAAQAAETYALQEAQLSTGRVSVNDVVGAFETKVRAERTAATLVYEATALRLRLAEAAGLLVNGDQM